MWTCWCWLGVVVGGRLWPREATSRPCPCSTPRHTRATVRGCTGREWRGGRGRCRRRRWRQRSRAATSRTRGLSVSRIRTGQGVATYDRRRWCRAHTSSCRPCRGTWAPCLACRCWCRGPRGGGRRTSGVSSRVQLVAHRGLVRVRGDWGGKGGERLAVEFKDGVGRRAKLGSDKVKCAKCKDAIAASPSPSPSNTPKSRANQPRVTSVTSDEECGA